MKPDGKPTPPRRTGKTKRAPSHSGDRTDHSPDEREGATEREVGDRSGPGAGYDNEPEQERDTGGVS